MKATHEYSRGTHLHLLNFQYLDRFLSKYILAFSEHLILYVFNPIQKLFEGGYHDNYHHNVNYRLAKQDVHLICIKHISTDSECLLFYQIRKLLKLSKSVVHWDLQLIISFSKTKCMWLTNRLLIFPQQVYPWVHLNYHYVTYTLLALTTTLRRKLNFQQYPQQLKASGLFSLPIELNLISWHSDHLSARLQDEQLPVLLPW